LCRCTLAGRLFHLVAGGPINYRFSVTLPEGNRAAVAPLGQFMKQDLKTSVTVPEKVLPVTKCIRRTG